MYPGPLNMLTLSPDGQKIFDEAVSTLLKLVAGRHDFLEQEGPEGPMIWAELFSAQRCKYRGVANILYRGSPPEDSKACKQALDDGDSFCMDRCTGQWSGKWLDPRWKKAYLKRKLEEEDRNYQDQYIVGARAPTEAELNELNFEYPQIEVGEDSAHHQAFSVTRADSVEFEYPASESGSTKDELTSELSALAREAGAEGSSRASTTSPPVDSKRNKPMRAAPQLDDVDLSSSNDDNEDPEPKKLKCTSKKPCLHCAKMLLACEPSPSPKAKACLECAGRKIECSWVSASTRNLTKKRARKDTTGHVKRSDDNE